MFEHLKAFPPDPILGISVAYAADPVVTKIDVGVGVYRDETGRTPLMESVRLAEARVIAAQQTKSYLSTAGNAGFNSAMTELVLGAQHPAVADGRVVTLQSPGGCGALRLAADLVRTASPASVIAISQPTWPNHAALIGGASIPIVEYPYYDRVANKLLFPQMIAALEALPEESVVLLQPACHNPTGADLSAAQWDEVGALLARRRLLPLLDLAYQGLGEGLDEDASAVRQLCAKLPEVLVTVSCSKNFGLYRERAGAIIYVGRAPADVHAVHTHLMMLARRMYSMSPDHGAAIVGELWSDAGLRDLWRGELDAMRVRLNSLRAALASELAIAVPERDFGFIARQRGMFSLLGLSRPAVDALRVQHHVYCAPDSRINIAGLNTSVVPRLAAAVGAVVKAGL